MRSPMPEERRGSPRRRHYRMAKIKVGVSILAHDCIVIDMSSRNRNWLRASAGFELFLGVQRQLDHALEQLIGR